ncbi:MAG TPA: hypothetical protein VFD97_07145 [Acidimicrobiia bacterium]|nr:hypothetical protein [Acidimicrobiia bacterium]
MSAKILISDYGRTGMCCMFASLMLFGPRFAILIWWLAQPARWESAFSNFFVPLLGFLFLPWTTLAYVAVAPRGIVFFDWIIIGLGVLVDISGYTSSEYGRRQRYAAGTY